MQKPNILVWDLECHTFSFKAHKGFMLCGGFQTHGKPGVEILKRDNIQDNPIDDKKLVIAIHDRLVKADMWVTHNGKWFDVPWLNSRLLHWGHAPLPDIPHFDTCEVAYKKLRVGNSLGELGKFLNCKVKKTETDMNDWLMAGGGDRKALAKIVTHCIHDVRLTDEVYPKIRPLGFKHPNISLLTEEPTKCPLCGKKGTLVKNGFKIAHVKKAQRYQCSPAKKGCGGYAVGPYRTTDVTIRP